MSARGTHAVAAITDNDGSADNNPPRLPGGLVTLSTEATNFTWLINEFVDRVPGVAHVVVVSSDGLLLVMSDGLPRERADQLSAIASGLISLTSGAARCFDAGEVRQTIVEMDQGFLIVMAISDGSSLAVLASRSCDIGLVGYEMALLVSRAGELLTPDLQGRGGGSPASMRRSVHESRQRGPGDSSMTTGQEELGPLVRPYALTGGRTRPSVELAIEALVSTTYSGTLAESRLPSERAAIIRLCVDTRSVAEVAALLKVPLGVARVLVADMADAALVRIYEPQSLDEAAHVALLERVLSGLRRL